MSNFPIRGQGALYFYFTKKIGLYLCTRLDNDVGKTCRVPYDVEISAELEYNAKIEVNPNNRYELLPQIIGAKGPIRPTTSKGIDAAEYR